ncbi:MAG: LysM peptidoglycan-binding domain-containing protein [Firmicutes bacterium]|jgi:nucleoid-associated protein YgaU|nr:LysM peptidoglycan-binding domain-containing protein [Bacillota bacterium]
MSNYKMTLIVGGREINIPVLPAKLNVSSPGKNERVTVLELGEVLLLRKKGLRILSWESFFPVSKAPYTVGQIRDPVSIVQAIQKARDQKSPVRFLITGTDLDCNLRMGIDSFEYEERSGELGDLYYTIKLYEWKDISPKRIVLPEKKEEPAKTQEPERPGKPEQTSKTYTVKPGDCLWNIAKAIYGKGSDYTKIYNANKGVIGSNPNLIYAGQVFTIP